jgi:hypothetical protein
MNCESIYEIHSPDFCESFNSEREREIRERDKGESWKRKGFKNELWCGPSDTSGVRVRVFVEFALTLYGDSGYLISDI